MTTELALLAWAVVLGLVHVMATGHFTTRQHGLAYNMSPRDEQKPLTGVGARVQRAFANYMQTFPFFAAALLAAHAAGRHGGLTVVGRTSTSGRGWPTCRCMRRACRWCAPWPLAHPRWAS